MAFGTDYTPVGPMPTDIVLGDVDATSMRLARDIRDKGHGIDTRETMARMMLKSSTMHNHLIKVNNAFKVQNDEYYRQFSDVLKELSEDKDYHSLPEIAGARGGFGTLGERLDETTAQLAQTAKKSDLQGISLSYKESYDTLALLQAAYPAGDVFNHTVQADGLIYTYKDGWISTGIQANGTGIADGTVTPEKLNFLALKGVPSKNLFDKSKVTNGYYVSYLTGLTAKNENYTVSQNIPILPSTSYAIKHPEQSAFYTASGAYISGLSGSSPNLFTTPANAATMRISTMISNLDTQQLELGTAVSPYENFGAKLDPVTLGESAYRAIAQKIKTEGTTAATDNNPQKIIAHLENPFVLTRIKTIGDSITAGVGGTGFVAPRNDTSVSWVNMLRNHLLARYNKLKQVTMDDKRLIYTGAYSRADNASAHFKTQTEIHNNSLAKKIEFRFYGTDFDIIHTATPDSGKLGVYVDGSLRVTLDAYAPTVEYQKIVNVSGLSSAYHNVEIRETNSKNASSTGNTVRLEALQIPKTVVVENQGASGAPSDFVSAKVTNTDDFIFIQLGTNDRHAYLSTSKTKSNLRLYINHIRATTSGQPILMSANAVAVSDDTSGSRNFKMDEVDAAVRSVAIEEDVPFISNYDGFLKYEQETGLSVDSLLADGLHPNDAGYKVMYQNICRNIGLPIVRDGLTV